MSYMIDIRIVPEKIDIQYCIDAVLSPSSGGIDVFIGTVRDVTQGRRVIKLEFEAYEPMAISEMNKIAAQMMSLPSEADIAREIHKFLLNGLLYKGVKPVMWSVVEKTALAEAEVEYKEHKSITIWVKFPVITTHFKPAEGASVVIWTTTPWTMPSNKAVAFGKDIEYAIYTVASVEDGSRPEIREDFRVVTKRILQRL